MIFIVCNDGSGALPLGSKFIIEDCEYVINPGFYTFTINVWGQSFRLPTYYFNSCNVQLIA
jgi:hypothetical protein